MGSTSLCLELVNTSAGGTALRRIDTLEAPAGLAQWLGSWRHEIGGSTDGVALRVSEFRGLRGAIRDLLEALLSGRPLPAGALAKVNDACASAPTWVGLDPAGPVVVRTGAAVGRTVEILAAIARDAIEVIGSADRERLRRCPAPRCGRFFLEERRGTVWCSPSCGNRARVARHHARARGGATASGSDRVAGDDRGALGRDGARA